MRFALPFHIGPNICSKIYSPGSHLFEKKATRGGRQYVMVNLSNVYDGIGNYLYLASSEHFHRFLCLYCS